VQLMGNNNVYSIPLLIAGILALPGFLFFFYRAMVQDGIQKLVSLTLFLLGMAAVLHLSYFIIFPLRYIDPTVISPMRPPLNLFLIELIGRIGLLFGCIALFILLRQKKSLHLTGIAWILIGLVNLAELLQHSYRYITWAPPPAPAQKETGLLALIDEFARTTPYSMERYFSNIAYPLFWMILTAIVWRKRSLLRTRNNKQPGAGE
jgi:hypothetical protein